MKSIKNNKHNHLTATYYLLLKKHMIRHLKSYVDAFMELKPIEDARNDGNDVPGPVMSTKSNAKSKNIVNEKLPATLNAEAIQAQLS